MELRDILTSKLVGELTLTSRPTLRTTDTIAAAAAEMRNVSHGSAIVCDEGKLVGIFTERDLLRVISEQGNLDMSLADAMTAGPETVTTDDSLLEAVRRMDTGGYRRLPVVDSSGSPVGFIDVKSIVHFLVEHFPNAVYNQASQGESITRDREGA